MDAWKEYGPSDMTPLLVRVAPLFLGNLLGWHNGDPLTGPVVPGPVSVELQKRDTLLLEIGVITGDRNQIFGNIRDIDVDGDGNILVLDDQDFSLSWFGPDGRFRGRTGRDGGGPSEFRAPAGLAVSPAGQVYVLDAASRRIAEFALGEEGLEFVRTFPVPVYGSDMCVVDGRLVVLGVSDGTPKVYVLSEEGEVIRSFGAGFPRQLPPLGLERFTVFFDSSNGRGHVHCAGGDVFAIASERLGIVRWFSTQDDFIREVTINGFSPVTWTPNSGGGLSMGVDPATGVANTLKHLSGGEPGQILATIHGASMEDTQGRLDIYVLDSASGEQSSPIPSEAVASAYANDRLYSFVRDPYPKILVQTIPQRLQRH